MTHLAIVGSRSFIDYPLFCQHVNAWITTHGRPETIVSGGAPGADSMAARYALEYGIKPNILPAQWYTNGEYDGKAGFDRNTDIVTACTHAIAFPWQQTNGTQDTIRKLQVAKKPVTVVWIDPSRKVPLHLAFRTLPRKD